MGTLYIVATPIGNLEDISPRGVRILRESKLIAAEDTRHTAKLLNHFGIQTPLTSYFEHNKLTKLERILASLADGDVALVSDAGTPAVNDPGYELVRAALASGFDVRPIPGPSSPIAALSVSGLPTDAFLYLGYLPHKSKERRDLLSQIDNLRYTLIFLESPHRLTDALEDLLTTLGDRPICVAREMTKMYEEFWRGSLSGALEEFKAREIRGEFTLVVGGQLSVISEQWSEEELLAAIETELQRGKSAKEISVELAEQSGWGKKDVYARVNQRKQGG
ncbi:MAG: 16S rRNA (cytidine(1402)-2'-O)-methyltransferase [Chloroflexi bacterium]|nr:16S rRNA (cytidine(1402)-2'-O)-methyltransferase [Chloroflexota bacterium]